MKKIFILGSIILLLLVSIVLATPGMPNYFYGTVTVNGVQAPSGLRIDGKINDVTVASTQTVNGVYGYDRSFFVQDPYNDRNGETINFFIEDHDTGATATFSSEYAETRVDLTLNGVAICGDTKCNYGETCSSCQTDCGQCQTSSPVFSKGGGGGGGGGSLKMQCEDGKDNDNDGKIDMNDPGCQAEWDNTEDSDETGVEESEPEATACAPDWVCSDWLDCISGVQKRVCVDSQRCGIEEGKPIETQKCEVPQELRTSGEDTTIADTTSEKQGNFLTRITGAVTGGGVATWIAGIIVVAIVAGLIIFAKKRKKE